MIDNYDSFTYNLVQYFGELGVEVKATTSLSFSTVLSKGNFRYTSRPTSITSYDNGSKPDQTQTIYIKNFYINGTPQTAASFGLKYQGPKSLWVNINANYFDDIWVDFNPERRTIAAIENLYNDIEKAKLFTEQTKIDGQFTLDFSISKSWRIKNYNLSLNFNINNVLDNQKLVTSAYEQLRYDFADNNISKFPPKMYYAFGRTYYISLGVRF